jgi:hypothetical protein
MLRKEFYSYLSIVIAFLGHRSSQILQKVQDSKSIIIGLFALRLKTAIAQVSMQV